MPRDRSKEKETNALTSVRTVLSRAQTALDELEYGNSRHDGQWVGRLFDGPDYRFQDEDYDEMRAALEQVVELLSPWKKAGARRRR